MSMRSRTHINFVFRLKLELPDGVQWLWSRCVWRPHHRVGPDHLITRSEWRSESHFNFNCLYLWFKAELTLNCVCRFGPWMWKAAWTCLALSSPASSTSATTLQVWSHPTHTSPCQHTHLPHAEPCVCFTVEGEFISSLGVARVSDYNSPPVKKCVLHKVMSIIHAYWDTDACMFIYTSKPTHA